MGTYTALVFNPDGSLTLGLGPSVPEGVPPANWLPTTAGSPYELILALYGPQHEAAMGVYFPPPLRARP